MMGVDAKTSGWIGEEMERSTEKNNWFQKPFSEKQWRLFGKTRLLLSVFCVLNIIFYGSTDLLYSNLGYYLLCTVAIPLVVGIPVMVLLMRKQPVTDDLGKNKDGKRRWYSGLRLFEFFLTVYLFFVMPIQLAVLGWSKYVGSTQRVEHICTRFYGVSIEKQHVSRNSSSYTYYMYFDWQGHVKPYKISRDRYERYRPASASKNFLDLYIKKGVTGILLVEEMKLVAI